MGLSGTRSARRPTAPCTLVGCVVNRFLGTMGHTTGYRARTRHLFARKFRQKGVLQSTVYLRTFKIGDYVDIKVNGAIQKGMPHKYYHGRSGRVWNVTPRAVGVLVNKQIGNRIIQKKLHVRIEHVVPSKSRQECLERFKRNDALKAAAKKEGKIISTKRLPAQPRDGEMVSVDETIVLEPLKYEFIV